MKEHKGTTPKLPCPKLHFPLSPELIPNPANPQADSLPITAITHPHTWLCSVEKKRNCFNFPTVQGQISLLARRAVNFSGGPFAPYTKFVFSAPSLCKAQPLQEVQGILAAHPTPHGFAGAFCPLFLAMGTGRHRLWVLGSGFELSCSPRNFFHQERGRRIKDWPQERRHLFRWL